MAGRRLRGARMDSIPICLAVYAEGVDAAGLTQLQDKAIIDTRYASGLLGNSGSITRHSNL